MLCPGIGVMANLVEDGQSMVMVLDDRLIVGMKFVKDKWHSSPSVMAHPIREELRWSHFLYWQRSSGRCKL
jgi:hypothetical protein